MSESSFGPVEQTVARVEIQQLAYRYSSALERRDIDAMVDLFVPHARFGPFGEGPAALRRLTEESLAGMQLTVVLVHNHLIEFDATDRAHGEVWARCYAQTDTDGYLEQLLRYEDRYELHEGRWRFLHRRHRLWFGAAVSPSPLAQPEAHWPEHQVGVGDIPFENPEFVRWWDEFDQ
jgi:hypothetical protein